MAKLDEEEKIELRTRLEPDMRKKLDLSFQAWNAAANQDKVAALLTGPTLAWAESWMLTHADECEPSLKRYIVRSVARSTARSAKGRADQQVADLRRESRTYWAVIALAAFTVFTVVPSMIKDNFDRPPLSSAHTSPQAKATETEPPKEVMVTTVTIGPDGPVMSTSMQQKPGTPRTAASHGQAAQVSAAVAPTVTPLSQHRQRPRTEAERASDRLRHLSDITDKAMARGDERSSMLLAAEAMHEARASRFAKDPTIAVGAVSSLYRVLRARTPFLAESGAFATGTTPEFCEGGRVLASFADGRMEAWDSHAGRKIDGSTPSTDGLRLLSTDQYCTRMAFEGEDYGARIISLTNGQPIARLNGHEADLSAAAFSIDGNKIATASFDATARIWDGRTGKKIADLRGHEDRVQGVTFSRDGRLVVSWSEDRTARIWDATTGRSLFKLDGHKGTVTGASISPDSRLVLTTSLDGVARVWSSAGGKLEKSLSRDGSSIVKAEFSGDGQKIGSLGQSATVDIWHTASGKHIAELTPTSNDTRAFAFHPKSNLIATLAWSGRISLWNGETGGKIADLTRSGEPAASIAFSPDGERLSAIAQSGAMLGWPIFDTPELALAHATKKAGTCLTIPEREALHLARTVPEWCSESVAQLPTPQAHVPANREVP